VLHVGDAKTIRLPSLSGAGYEWTVDIIDGDPEPVAVEELHPDAPAGPPGAGPNHVFRLSALRPGQAEVHFEQRRPWESGVAAHDTRTFEVVVET
jgi:predicted secreted protein